MKQTLQIILEKVKEGSLTVDEGLIIIESLIEKKSHPHKRDYCNSTKESWDDFEQNVERKIKTVFSKIFDDKSINEFNIIGEKIGKNIQTMIKDWMDKEKK